MLDDNLLSIITFITQDLSQLFVWLSFGEPYQNICGVAINLVSNFVHCGLFINNKNTLPGSHLLNPVIPFLLTHENLYPILSTAERKFYYINNLKI
jgi:hypothetical protein